ncbi:hypothetical protein J2T08_002838 [Neorhizobium galegae]|uniref:hypothetical protein n=1 Tax=Neorhizobium galegae TaxID=399 RepID=UPI00277DE75C|nr:hypothetical protein [Neorhizobium galegae]MDQ0134920.1 hypothetical protein [Neorhizobium galegae]
MKIEIDSYCYHRFFGEIYASLETDLATRLTKGNFSTRQSLPVRKVSCLAILLLPRERLSASGMDCVSAWGHPRGGSLHDAQYD